MNCRWIRFLINRALDDDRPLSPRVQQHVAGCAGCREWFEQQRSLVQRLHADTPTADEAAPSPFLQSRILNRLKAEQPSVRPLVGRWAVAGVAMTVIALVAWSGLTRNPQPAEEVLASSPASPASVELSLVWLQSSSRLTSGGDWLQVATNLNQPLQREVDLVIGDARTALRALAADLVPAPLLARNE